MLYFYVSLGVLTIFGPLTWVHKIQRFRFGYIFGVVMIFTTVIAISIYCFQVIGERDWARPDPNY